MLREHRAMAGRLVFVLTPKGHLLSVTAAWTGLFVKLWGRSVHTAPFHIFNKSEVPSSLFYQWWNKGSVLSNNIPTCAQLVGGEARFQTQVCLIPKHIILKLQQLSQFLVGVSVGELGWGEEYKGMSGRHLRSLHSFQNVTFERHQPGTGCFPWLVGLLGTHVSQGTFETKHTGLTQK